MANPRARCGVCDGIGGRCTVPSGAVATPETIAVQSGALELHGRLIIYLAGSTWEPDVFAFLQKHMAR